MNCVNEHVDEYVLYVNEHVLYVLYMFYILFFDVLMNKEHVFYIFCMSIIEFSYYNSRDYTIHTHTLLKMSTNQVTVIDQQSISVETKVLYNLKSVYLQFEFKDLSEAERRNGMISFDQIKQIMIIEGDKLKEIIEKEMVLKHVELVVHPAIENEKDVFISSRLMHFQFPVPVISAARSSRGMVPFNWFKRIALFKENKQTKKIKHWKDIENTADIRDQIELVKHIGNLESIEKIAKEGLTMLSKRLLPELFEVYTEIGKEDGEFNHSDIITHFEASRGMNGPQKPKSTKGSDQNKFNNEKEQPVINEEKQQKVVEEKQQHSTINEKKPHQHKVVKKAVKKVVKKSTVTHKDDTIQDASSGIDNPLSNGNQSTSPRKQGKQKFGRKFSVNQIVSTGTSKEKASAAQKDAKTTSAQVDKKCSGGREITNANPGYPGEGEDVSLPASQ